MEPRVALISGSTAGLGLDLAVRLCRAGHRVALNGRDRARVSKAVVDVQSAVPDAEVTGFAADVSDSRQVTHMVRGCKDEFGPVDMFVHAAVVRHEAPLIDTTDQMWRVNMGACLDGAFYCTRAVLPDMVERGWGRIIYLGGISTELGLPGRAALIAAKNGLYGLTKAVAAEVGHRNITVNSVSPGIIEDEPDMMADDERTARRTALMETSRLRRFGTTREVNATVMFLLSEDGGYVTAQRWSVSGGLVAC